MFTSHFVGSEGKIDGTAFLAIEIKDSFLRHCRQHLVGAKTKLLAPDGVQLLHLNKRGRRAPNLALTIIIFI